MVTKEEFLSGCEVWQDSIFNGAELLMGEDVGFRDTGAYQQYCFEWFFTNKRDTDYYRAARQIALINK